MRNKNESNQYKYCDKYRLTYTKWTWSFCRISLAKLHTISHRTRRPQILPEFLIKLIIINNFNRQWKTAYNLILMDSISILMTMTSRLFHFIFKNSSKSSLTFWGLFWGFSTVGHSCLWCFKDKTTWSFFFSLFVYLFVCLYLVVVVVFIERVASDVKETKFRKFILAENIWIMQSLVRAGVCFDKATCVFLFIFISGFFMLMH